MLRSKTREPAQKIFCTVELAKAQNGKLLHTCATHVLLSAPFCRARLILLGISNPEKNAK
jgi:hypothetical protein